jgi:hypothetical protein
MSLDARPGFLLGETPIDSLEQKENLTEEASWSV